LKHIIFYKIASKTFQKTTYILRALNGTKTTFYFNLLCSTFEHLLEVSKISLGAIQILSYIFLAFFWPPLPHVSFGDMYMKVTFFILQNISFSRLYTREENIAQKRPKNVTLHIRWPPPSPLCYLVTLSQTPSP